MPTVTFEAENILGLERTRLVRIINTTPEQAPYISETHIEGLIIPFENDVTVIATHPTGDRIGFFDLHAACKHLVYPHNRASDNFAGNNWDGEPYLYTNFVNITDQTVTSPSFVYFQLHLRAEEVAPYRLLCLNGANGEQMPTIKCERNTPLIYTIHTAPANAEDEYKIKFKVNSFVGAASIGTEYVGIVPVVQGANNGTWGQPINLTELGNYGHENAGGVHITLEMWNSDLSTLVSKISGVRLEFSMCGADCALHLCYWNEWGGWQSAVLYRVEENVLSKTTNVEIQRKYFTDGDAPTHDRVPVTTHSRRAVSIKGKLNVPAPDVAHYNGLGASEIVFVRRTVEGVTRWVRCTVSEFSAPQVWPNGSADIQVTITLPNE